ncbi:hypothetical protein LZ32DRAFT_147886 [Colletotrichum eremochloae]|nr:hypothetical protein LZ32DRAFT_147886 [Colletotrichum eremochloae]
MSTLLFLFDSSLSNSPIRPTKKNKKKLSLLWLNRWPVYMMVILYIFPRGFRSRVESKTHVLFNLVTQISLSHFFKVLLHHFLLCISPCRNQIRANHQEGQKGPREIVARNSGRIL